MTNLAINSNLSSLLYTEDNKTILTGQSVSANSTKHLGEFDFTKAGYTLIGIVGWANYTDCAFVSCGYISNNKARLFITNSASFGITDQTVSVRLVYIKNV